jgi:MFS family permease
MYPSIRTSATDTAEPDARAPENEGIGRNVYMLGVTSMVTDVSSEMITAILPLYLVFQLRLSPLEFGFFNGGYLAIAGLMTIAGGVIADRTNRYKEVAGFGYGISAFCKIGLIAARNTAVPATAALWADRAGKGMRTAPRDALISLSAPVRRLGTAFGVHRAFDTFGALLGPVIAFFVLEAAPRAYDAVFVISFLAAILGLAVLVLFVENRHPKHHGIETPSFRESIRLFEHPQFRTLTLVGTLLGLFTVTDALIYLVFQNNSDFVSRFFPLLYVGTALSYLVLAIPMGRVADRFGRARVFVAGYVLLLVVYLVLLAPDPGVVALLAMLGFLGAFYACTDGVFAAMTSTTVDDELRTSGMAVVKTAAAFSGFVSSLAFGAIWEWWGSTRTVQLFVVLLAAGILVAAAALKVRTRKFG